MERTSAPRSWVTPDHSGYGRPVMKIEDGGHVVTNAPIPRLRWSASRVVNRADFRSLELSRRVLSKLFKPREIPGRTMLASIEKIGPVAAKIFETLDQLGREKNIVQVFVYLPVERDLREDLQWHSWLAEILDKRLLEISQIRDVLLKSEPGAASITHDERH